MPDDEDRPLIDADLTIGLVTVLMIAATVVLLSGCRTVDQITKTPEEVWMSLWLILEAMVMDIVDMVRFVL